MIRVLSFALDALDGRGGVFFGHLKGSANMSFSQSHHARNFTNAPFNVSWHVRKNFFWSLKNCFLQKPKFSSSSWGKQCFRFPSLSTYRFCVGWKQSKHVRIKTTFRSLKHCASAKPKFSSSYWGMQCFRSPSLSTYRFCVGWKQSKHVRKKTIFRSLKNCFSAKPDFIP